MVIMGQIVLGNGLGRNEKQRIDFMSPQDSLCSANVSKYFVNLKGSQIPTNVSVTCFDKCRQYDVIKPTGPTLSKCTYTDMEGSYNCSDGK